MTDYWPLLLCIPSLAQPTLPGRRSLPSTYQGFCTSSEDQYLSSPTLEWYGGKHAECVGNWYYYLVPLAWWWSSLVYKTMPPSPALGIQTSRVLVLGHGFMDAVFPLWRTSGYPAMLPSSDLDTQLASNIHPKTFKHPTQTFLNIKKSPLKNIFKHSNIHLKNYRIFKYLLELHGN